MNVLLNPSFRLYNNIHIFWLRQVPYAMVSKLKRVCRTMRTRKPESPETKPFLTSFHFYEVSLLWSLQTCSEQTEVIQDSLS